MDRVSDFRELFHALNTWANASDRGVRTGGGPDGYNNIQLHFRPDPRGPETQLTFRAAVIDGRPTIQVQRSPALEPLPPSGHAVTTVIGRSTPIDSSIESGREPNAVCEGCGVTGTVGRAIRTDGAGGVTETHKFCFECWPEQSARYRARWEEQDRRVRDRSLRSRKMTSGAGPGMGFEAATWHNTLALVKDIERMMIAPIPPAPHDLEAMAAQIEAWAPNLEGDMPFEVEAFIRRYGKDR